MPSHIVWIVLEDASPRLGCYGDDIARTPHIDRLADQGRRFSRMFSTTGTCAPSRASLVTGLMPQSLGAHHMRTDTHDVDGLPKSYQCVPPHYVTAVPELLRHAGYYCTLDVKTDYQFGEPFTMWDAHGPGVGWWDEAREPDQPFFAMMTNAVTHESGMWDPADEWPDQEGGRIDDPVTDSEAVDVPPYLVDTPATRTAIARQYDNIARLDDWVGELLHRLERDGYTDNTVVILVGDHGEGLPRKKRWPFDSGTHVPLLIKWPGVTEGGVSDRLVSGIDIGPTTLSIADRTPPRYMEGRVCIGDAAEPRREVLVTTRDRIDESYDMVRSVRDDRFRYVRYEYPECPFIQHVPYRDRHPAMRAVHRALATGDITSSSHPWVAEDRPSEALYDLTEDPHEIRNLASDPGYQKPLERLRAALEEWRRSVGEQQWGNASEQQMRDRMRPDGRAPQTASPQVVIYGPKGTRRRLERGDPIEGPTRMGLYCATQGASLSWSIDRGPWKIFSGPRRVEHSVHVRARSVRYGFQPSEEISRTIEFG